MMKCKRSTIVLSFVMASLALLLALTFWQYAWLQLRVAFAKEQTEIFHEMRAKALQSDATEAADCLQYVVTYYPSGSKQQTGSRLDTLVERERTWAIREIIADLQSKTHEDLGPNPEPWIKKHARN
jgi:hypothetical protein